jgi:AcrR family transcriptional regulator
MDISFTEQLPTIIAAFEQQGLVTRTFRRLDLPRQLAIISAIMDESAESGPADINIKKVAERAGVSIGSLYQYFNHREGLLNFATELTVQQTVASFNTFLPYLDQLSFEEAYTIYLDSGLDWGKEQQQFVRFFARAAYQNQPHYQQSVVRPVADCMLNIVRTMVIKAQERGELRDDLDSDALARLFHAISIALGDPVLLPDLNAYFQVSNETNSIKPVFSALMDILKHGAFSANFPEEQQK